MNPPRYTVDTEFRQRWAHVVRDRAGPTVARCDTPKAAEKVAKALNIAEAASIAAAVPVTP